MTNPHDIGPLGQEWIALQHEHEQHERNALLIKLLAVTLTVVALGLQLSTPATVGVVALLWLQDGIVKTFQSRLGLRLARIEALVREAAPGAQAFQLHSEWLASRKGSAGLLIEYLVNACKPTVAFPYVVLVFGLVLLR